MNKKFTFEAHIGDKVSKTFDVMAPSENQASRDACRVVAALNLAGHSVRLVQVNDGNVKPAAEDQPITVSKPPKEKKAPAEIKKPKPAPAKNGEKKSKGAA